jgi:flagellar basal body P-ring formation protein FlgA
MKTFLCLTLLFAFSRPGFAQIDKILAPLPGGSEMEQREIQLVASIENRPGAISVPKEDAAPEQQFLKAGDLLARLQQQIADYYALKGDFKLDFTSPWKPVQLPGDDFDVTITDYPGGGLGGTFLIRCKIVSGGNTLGEWQLSLRAQLWQEVWGASAGLDRGQPLDRSLVAAQKVDVLRDKQTFLTTDCDPAAYDAAQNIQPGRPLTKRQVTERPIIHKGQVVEVIAHQGLFEVRMKALALEDGPAKAIIKMRNTDSQKEFNAQIVNENQVQVNF